MLVAASGRARPSPSGEAAELILERVRHAIPELGRPQKDLLLLCSQRRGILLQILVACLPLLVHAWVQVWLDVGVNFCLGVFGCDVLGMVPIPLICPLHFIGFDHQPAFEELAVGVGLERQAPVRQP